MRKIALVFPGQGTQHVGMGSSLLAEFDVVRDVFDRASTVLGMDMRKLCLEGPQEKLDLTVNTQIAVLTLSIAIYSIIKEKTSIKPIVMAGHSLGEYTALYAANAIGFEDVFSVVQARARYHQEAVPAGLGAMAAIIGLDGDSVESLCSEVSEASAKVSVAIHNTLQQIVVSGHAAAVEKAMLAAKQKGARQVVRLPISAPCHCGLLQKAADMLKEKLEPVEFYDPSVLVIPNSNPAVFYTKDNARKLLVDQIVLPVQWRQTVEKMTAMGVGEIIEIGPKKIICGLIKRINKDIELFSVEDVDSLHKTAELFSA
ncbi:MAG: [acyl-carrier-protein] S-malonyltransferase [Deltaproteobacteria bacterium RBG_19FT_COMBO_43_11]|nr:MAG: [acyl-carrier-protein] S-malonyltransferase [Deltaproteobacteria bacterium RBG_19FT_COMBO_43_11]